MSIVGHGEVDPRMVVKHPRNPKIHTAEQNAVVEASLTELGWLKSVIINRTTGHLLDGEDRVERAIARGEASVPVEYVAIPEAEEGKALLLLDQSAALAEPHPERWAELRAEVQTQEPALLGFWAEYAAERGWAPVQGNGLVAPPVSEADVPEDRLDAIRAKWPVAPGEVWTVGRHRLICDDCLNPDVLGRLLAGTVPTMVLADPPYGIGIVLPSGYVGGGEEYGYPLGGVKRDGRRRVSGGQRVKDRTGHYPIEGRVRFAGWPAPGEKVRKYPDVVGDESTETAIRAARYYLTAYPQACHVWWGGNYYADHLPASSCWLVWDKETTGHFADCELAWTNQPRATKRFRHMWNGMLRASEHDTRRWHPTQKPVALMAWVYETLGQAGDVVLDPFVGSGPTLIAAEQRGQTLYGCELSPEYVGIALERWAILTGGVPKRVAWHSN